MPRLHTLALFTSASVSAACAGQAPRVEQAAAPVTTVTFEAEAPSVASAKLPYAPTRTSPTEYSWRRAPKTTCLAPTHLRFDGSHGDFPLLPDDFTVAITPQETKGGDDAAAAHGPRSADQVIASLRPRFRQCFSSWFDRGANAEGSVRFALELACNGDVEAVTAKSSGVDEPTVACLFGVVARAEFEPPSAGQALLQVPVVFKNTER
jgi:hypothetical protein